MRNSNRFFKSSFHFLIVFVLSQLVFCQINTKNIEIVRDHYGVPHIFTKTNAELAYGLAWAHAEDDFNTIQLSFLAGNALLSKEIGNKGIPVDFLTQSIRSQSLVEKEYESKISEAYKKVLEGYCQGINNFAAFHPNQVLVKELFPLTPQKLLVYGQLQLFVSSMGDYWVGKIVGNKLDVPPDEVKGSNTFAFSTKKTKNNKTFLAINTHQPLDGPVSWYEAHLVSEEGTNILGALFAGTPQILIGANEHLAWAHTVNYPDKTDVFKLEMHPTEKLKYKFDDDYLALKEYRAKLRVKILGIPLTVKKKYYESVYGPTYKNKSGYYSVRTPSLFEIRGLEQWWRMNHAKSFTEFYEALKMKAIPGYNIGYADKNDTIFYISNGLIPKRKEGYDWKNIVPGNTSETLWTETYDIEELPQVIQPESGYIYNANHSPFLSTDEEENPKVEDYSPLMGYVTYNNNRSIRLKTLIDSIPKIDYEKFKLIKYDRQLPTPFHYSNFSIAALETIKAEEYPELTVLINRIQKWNRKAEAHSLGAGVFLMLYHKLQPYFKSLPEPKVYSEKLIIQELKEVKKQMLTHFNTTDVSLGDYQRLVRGEKNIPIYGIPDVITSMHSVPYKNGRVRVTAGESYIELVTFSEEGVSIESVMPYGSSDHPDSPYYSDQMQLYDKFKTKKMSLDKKEVYQNAVKIYHPK